MTPEGLATFLSAIRDITVTGAVAYGFWLFMTNRLVTPKTVENLLLEVARTTAEINKRCDEAISSREEMRAERDKWQSIAVEALYGLKLGVDTTRTVVEAAKSRGA